MTVQVRGFARGVATFYSDGAEAMEIHTPKSEAHGLPFVDGQRVPVSLRIGAREFIAGLRATESNRYVWISPDVRDSEGRKARLVDILKEANIGKNQRLGLLVNGTNITVQSAGISVFQQVFPEEVEPGRVYVEGATTVIEVTRYERDLAARAACIAHHGAQCSVCSFNFGSVYGEIGVGFIHVHHLVPLAMISEEYIVDPIRDLVPVCPNCHSMLHRRAPPFSVAELKKLIGEIG